MRKLWLLCGLLCFWANANGAEKHTLWTVQGKHNTVYLLGSVHFLPPSESLPAEMERAYEDAEALLMEIDMDDLNQVEAQMLALELGMLPAAESLKARLGEKPYEKVAAFAEKLGLDSMILNRFQPWFAAITLTQLQMMKLGLDPKSGVEQRFLARAAEDHKEIQGLETLREQFGLLAQLPDREQREFLLYSVEDADRAAREVNQLLAAWRTGNVQALQTLLAEGMERYPDLYRPLTTDRNRKWMSKIDSLLDDEQDYLIIVGALHLVGRDSVIDLLQREGRKVTQH